MYWTIFFLALEFGDILFPLYSPHDMFSFSQWPQAGSFEISSCLLTTSLSTLKGQWDWTEGQVLSHWCLKLKPQLPAFLWPTEFHCSPSRKKRITRLTSWYHFQPTIYSKRKQLNVTSMTTFQCSGQTPY